MDTSQRSRSAGRTLQIPVTWLLGIAVGLALLVPVLVLLARRVDPSAGVITLLWAVPLLASALHLVWARRTRQPRLALGAHVLSVVGLACCLVAAWVPVGVSTALYVIGAASLVLSTVILASKVRRADRAP